VQWYYLVFFHYQEKDKYNFFIYNIILYIMSVPYFNSSQVQEIYLNESSILNKIKNLQNIEKNMYSELVDPKLSQQRGKEIVDQINRLSDARVDLYENLKNTYGIVQDNVANTRGELVNQKAMIKYMESELNKTKKDLQDLEKAKYNKLRMVEINTYNANRYNSQVNFVKGVVILLVILFIIKLINVQEIIPVGDGIISGLMVLVFSVFGIWAIMYWYNYMRRDNMNWDQYNWYFDQDANDPTVLEYDLQQLRKIQGIEVPTVKDIGCVGQMCCSNDTIWDSKTKKCIGSDLKDVEKETSNLKDNEKLKENKQNEVDKISKPINVQPFSKVEFEIPKNISNAVADEINNQDLTTSECLNLCKKNDKCSSVMSIPKTGCVLFNNKAIFVGKDALPNNLIPLYDNLKNVGSELHIKN